MSGLYVASNVGALSATTLLQRNNAALSDTLTRLSTGLRINSGKDDPAGLIASELLKSDISATQQAVKNSQRANSMIAVADSALSQVGNLLNDIRVLVNEGANEGGMSDSQISANQLQIDASIDSIDRIARTTNFQGKKLLDGSLDFNTSGIDNTKLSNVSIQAANFGTADSLNVKVQVLEESKKGTLIYQGSGVSTDTVLEIGGSKGSEIFKFGANTTNAEMAEAINRISDATGVEAHVEGQAQRGSVILHTAGANNDILITANEEGYENGNYTFRIVQGAENDVKIVTAPDASKPGVVEISLQGSYESKFNAFAGIYNITTNTDFSGDPSSQETSVSITRGTQNTSQFFETDSAAAGTTASGVTGTVAINEDSGNHMSQYNGWTIVYDTANGTQEGVIDQNSKTITFNDITIDANGTNSFVNEAFTRALAGTLDALGANASTITYSGGTLKNGDRITFSGGGDAGELFVTYKEGATVGEIQDMINKTPNVQATLASGVSRDDKIPALPSGKTYMSNDSAAMSRYSSSASSQDVIDMINSKLGDKFTAVALGGEGANGRVGYQDASLVYGDVNLDNAIQFSGMDSGPVIRLSTTNAQGEAAKNQALSVSILQPTDADIANGIHTQILQINLATDGAGNSITTAKDIADLFDRLTPAETLGVSAEIVYPDGVDANGRNWVDDGCGNISIVQDCVSSNYGTGIVQPTSVAGDCEVINNDLFLLGNNQQIVDDYAVARIGYVSKNDGAPATGSLSLTDAAEGTGALKIETTDNTNYLNGLNIVFSAVDNDSSFDIDTGTLTVGLSANYGDFTDNDILSGIINTALASNWFDNSGDGISDWITARYPDAVIDTPLTVEVSGDMTKEIMDAQYTGESVTLSGGSAAVDKEPTEGSTPKFDANKSDVGSTGITGASTSILASGLKINITALATGSNSNTDVTVDAATSSYNAETGTLNIALTVDNTAWDAGAVGFTNINDLNTLINDYLASQGVLGDVTLLGTLDPTELDTAPTVIEFTGGEKPYGVDQSATGVATISNISGTPGDATLEATDVIALQTTGGTAALNGKEIQVVARTLNAGESAVEISGNTLFVYVDPDDMTGDATGVTNVIDAVNTALASDFVVENFLGGETGVEVALIQAGAEFSAAAADGDTITFAFANGSKELTDPVGDTVGIKAISSMDDQSGLLLTTNDGTSALNGITIKYSYDEPSEGFDERTGTLTVFIDNTIRGDNLTEDALNAITNSSIAANWESIRSYTQAVGLPVKVSSVATDITQVGNGTTVSFAGNTDDVSGTQVRGIGLNDPALIITAKEPGTSLAGTNIKLVYDEAANGLSASYDKERKELVITYNQHQISAEDLAAQLKNIESFSRYFDAEAPLFENGGSTAGTVYFAGDAVKTAYTMSGGYKVDSDPVSAKNHDYTGTSSGIAMTGQSDANERLVLTATESGSEHFVDVNVVSGSFRTFCPLGYEMSHLDGKDAVVTVNGQKAAVYGDDFTVSSSSLQMSGNVSKMKKGESTSFKITGGGANFQLGPDVVSTQQYRLSIPSVNSANLGGLSGKLYQLKTGEAGSLKNDTKLADKIVQEAISSISSLRGQLGAFQKSTLEPNIAVLEDTIEELSAAEALISNADFAKESADLARYQLLVQSGAKTLALANQTPQYAAQLI